MVPALAHHVPALVVSTSILIEVGLRGLVWGVCGAERQVGEERPVRPHTLAVGDHLKQLVD